VCSLPVTFCTPVVFHMLRSTMNVDAQVEAAQAVHQACPLTVTQIVRVIPWACHWCPQFSLTGGKLWIRLPEQNEPPHKTPRYGRIEDDPSLLYRWIKSDVNSLVAVVDLLMFCFIQFSLCASPVGRTGVRWQSAPRGGGGRALPTNLLNLLLMVNTSNWLLNYFMLIHHIRFLLQPMHFLTISKMYHLLFRAKN